jgi:hypothetical protein
VTGAIIPVMARPDPVYFVYQVYLLVVRVHPFSVGALLAVELLVVGAHAERCIAIKII